MAVPATTQFAGDRLEVRLRWIRALSTFGIGLAFLVVLPVLVLAEARPSWLYAALSCGSFLLALFVAIVGMRYVTHRGPTLLLDRNGLDHAWYGRVPWGQVHGLGLRTFRAGRAGPQHQLVLCVREPGRYLQRMPGAMNLLASRRSRDAAYGDLVIPLDILDATPQRIESAALALRDRVHPPRDPTWFAGFDAALVASQVEQEALLARMTELAAKPEANSPADLAEFQLVAAALAAQSDETMRLFRREATRQRTQGWIAVAMTLLVVVLLALRMLRFG